MISCLRASSSASASNLSSSSLSSSFYSSFLAAASSSLIASIRSVGLPAFLPLPAYCCFCWLLWVFMAKQCAQQQQQQQIGMSLVRMAAMAVCVLSTVIRWGHEGRSRDPILPTKRLAKFARKFYNPQTPRDDQHFLPAQIECVEETI